MKEEDQNIELLNDKLVRLEFPEDKLVELDLGCGKGIFSTQLAQKYPERLIASTDVMIGRLRKLNKRNKRLALENCRFLRCEAWHLFNQSLPDESIFRVHLLCPDPWPKEKHSAYRLISSEFLWRLYKKLVKGGIFHLSTDDNSYYTNALAIFDNAHFFRRDDSLIQDVLDIKTDFEKKWNELGLTVNHAAWLKL